MGTFRRPSRDEHDVHAMQTHYKCRHKTSTLQRCLHPAALGKDDRALPSDTRSMESACPGCPSTDMTS